MISDSERLRLLTPPEVLIQLPDVAPLFQKHGPVAQALGERYRQRIQQIEMAQAVRQALNEGCPALIEAGTGCGKSFAYLVPLVWSGVRAFVSTANKTLQTQLWEKDLPTLQRVAPRRFSVALLKGRSNYVCLLKLRDLARQQEALPGFRTLLGELSERLKASPSGDVEELRLGFGAREAVTADERSCLRKRCPFVDECYYELAKEQAEQADIVVLNHALLMMNLLQPFLTPRPVIVVDEAHELERYATNALRQTLEYTLVPALVNDPVVQKHVEDRLRQDTVLANNRLFVTLASRSDRYERRWAVEGELREAFALSSWLNVIHERLWRAYPSVPGGDENEENVRHQAVLQWAEQLASQVALLAQEPPPEYVRYCESRVGEVGLDSVVLVREPVQVADFLRTFLFGPVKRVVCTGATLTVDGRFDYFCLQTGAPREGVIERVIESPFDYPRQALLYTPNGLEPDYGVGEEEYVRRLVDELWRLLRASRGRAFVLCTSTRRMNELYELLGPRLDYPVLCQGEGLSRGEILERFRNEPGSVLFATRSFWEGVDIPGEALSLVVIDKLPFSPHRDPVIERRQELVRQRGGDPFAEFQLPEAILLLKQGVGRLIRSETDRGVIAILDSRINSRAYGARIIGSLPPARRTRDIEDVEAFFDSS